MFIRIVDTSRENEENLVNRLSKIEVILSLYIDSEQSGCRNKSGGGSERVESDNTCRQGWSNESVGVLICCVLSIVVGSDDQSIGSLGCCRWIQ